MSDLIERLRTGVTFRDCVDEADYSPADPPADAYDFDGADALMSQAADRIAAAESLVAVRDAQLKLADVALARAPHKEHCAYLATGQPTLCNCWKSEVGQ